MNNKKDLCKQCAPDLGVEMAKAQAERSVQEIHAHACMAEEEKRLGGILEGRHCCLMS